MSRKVLILPAVS